MELIIIIQRRVLEDNSTSRHQRNTLNITQQMNKNYGSSCTEGFVGLRGRQSYLFSWQERKCAGGTECPGEQKRICKYSLSRCDHIGDNIVKSETDKTFYFSSQKFPLNAFGRPFFFFFSLRLYQNILLCKAHHRKFLSSAQPGIMRAIKGDLGRMQDEWGLSLGFASEVSTLCFLTTHCCRIPLNPLHGGTKILQCSSHGRKKEKKKKTQQKKRRGSSSAFCLFLQETDRWLY